MAGISALTNIAAMQSMYAMNQASRAMYTSMERLATGKKINRASDDPAGVQAVDQLKARLATIHKRIDTIDFQEHYLGAREGAESVMSDLLVQLKGDVTMAANKSGLTDGEKQALQEDATSVLKTIDYLAQSTTFNGQQILTGTNTNTLGTGVVQRPHDPPHIDPNDPNQPPPSRDGEFYSILDLAHGGKLNLVDGDIESAAKVVDAAVTSMSTNRAAIGTQLNSMQSEKQGLMVEMENTEAARSQIEDTDYAEETSKLVRAEVLREASLYVMQLAGKQQSQTVLSLLK
jgi:flagellin